MLTIYRRHKKSCAHREQGRDYRRCRCPIWVDGTLRGKETRESLRELDWDKAQRSVRDRELASGPIAEDRAVSIVSATAKYIADAEARQLSRETVKKYKRLFKKLESFAGGRGVKFIDELDLDITADFRSSWKLGPRTSAKELDRLKAFFNFVRDREWITKNPARSLKAPKTKLRPTMPYTQAEMVKILAGIELYAKTAGAKNAQRLRAFVLLLRYSGMRIGDTVRCSVDRIEKNRLFLYTQKTETPVYCVLPEFVVKALDATPRASDRFYFWSGESTLHSAVGKWQRRLQRLFELAEVPKGHAHRFRDTFACELLAAGVPMDRVSVLLGHQSIRVTETHYAPWTQSRQEQIEADLIRVWRRDSVALLETKGTPRVHGQKSRYN
jgi:integrase/recombinase XerD